MIMKKIIYVLLGIILTCSCEGWFDLAPDGGLNGGQVLFQNEATFRDYLNGIYVELRNENLYGNNLGLGGVEYFSGNLTTYDSSSEQWVKFDFSDETNRNRVYEMYKLFYGAIYSCNNFIYLLNKAENVKFIEGSKEMMLSEAKALRAFLHFELIKLFSPAYVVDNNSTKIAWVDNVKGQSKTLSTKELINLIISELEIAGEELEKFDPIITGMDYDTNALLGTSVENRRWKLNYYGVQATLARVYMFKAD